MPLPNSRSLRFKNIVKALNESPSEPEKENLPRHVTKPTEQPRPISKPPSINHLSTIEEEETLPLNDSSTNIPTSLYRRSSWSSLSSQQTEKDFSPASDDDHEYNPRLEVNSSSSESSFDSPKRKRLPVIQDKNKIVQPIFDNPPLPSETTRLSESSSSTSGSSSSSDSSSDSDSDSSVSSRHLSKKNNAELPVKRVCSDTHNNQEIDCSSQRKALTSLQLLALEYSSDNASDSSTREVTIPAASDDMDYLQNNVIMEIDIDSPQNSPIDDAVSYNIESSDRQPCDKTTKNMLESDPIDTNENYRDQVAQKPCSQELKNPMTLKMIAMQSLNSAISSQVASLPETTHENLQTDVPGVSRKRKRGTNKRALAKRLRNMGLSYTSTKNKKEVADRKMGSPCSQRCRLKCFDKFSDETRTTIFKSYWKTGSLSQQRDYIAKHIEEIKPKYQYKKINSNRKPKHHFMFTINGEKNKVCKIFFRNTLGITDRQIRTVIEKLNSEGIVDPELRGKHGNHGQIKVDLIDGVRKHINSIPRIESHYLRKQTTREFIEGGKTVSDLYSDYKDECVKKNLDYVKINMYRKVFKEEFNISFFVPKKDQCDQCLMYQNAEISEKQKLEAAHKSHIAEKEKSREEKLSDKALIDDKNTVACYDLQAMLPVPKGQASSFYYMCKLNCLNFTISELKADQTECFFWNEVEGAKGVNEIASCVFRYLEKKSSSSTEPQNIIFYSDNCCGQQKNQFMFSMYIYVVKNCPNIKSITHKFLIKGHTQNEGDSVHATIEKEIKKMLKAGPIYVSDQYINAIRQAKKKGRKYAVNEMSHSEFYDIKSLQEYKLTRNTEGGVVKVTDIKILKVEKSEDDSGDVRVFYKTSYFQESFKEIKLQKHGRTRPQLKRLYVTKLPLGDRKKADLRSLIAKNAIPPYYASSFYNNIL